MFGHSLTMLSTLLVFLSALLVGAILGYVTGFALTSHKDVIAGVRPKTQNKFILILARPTTSLSAGEKVLLALLMLAWLPTFFGLFGIPAIVGTKLGIEDDVTVWSAYLILVGAILLARRYGARAWQALL